MVVIVDTLYYISTVQYYSLQAKNTDSDTIRSIPIDERNKLRTTNVHELTFLSLIQLVEKYFFKQIRDHLVYKKEKEKEKDKVRSMPYGRIRYTYAYVCMYVCVCTSYLQKLPIDIRVRLEKRESSEVSRSFASLRVLFSGAVKCR